MRMYEAMEGRLCVLLHMGDVNTNKSKPESLANIVKTFPRLKVIGAHFGGYSEWDSAVSYLADLRIFVDTSSTLPFITPVSRRRGRASWFARLARTAACSERITRCGRMWASLRALTG